MGLLNTKSDNFELAAIATSKDAAEVREFLENIIALMPGHVYWKDRQGILLGCNDLQAQSAGLLSRKDIVGKTDYDLPWKDQADALRKVDLQVIETGIPVTVEEISTLSNGKEAIFLSKKVPLYHRGKIIGILGLSFDITEQKNTQKELLETRYKLDGMSLVSSIMAHELRTPLCTFGISSEAAKKFFPLLKQAYLWARKHGYPGEDIAPEYLDDLEAALNSMYEEIRGSFGFIDIMLKNSEMGTDIGTSEIFLVSECVEKALSRYPFDLGRKELVHWNNNPATDFSIKADKLLIIHVLFNLLKNALYYIAAAGKGDIKIWLEQGEPFNKIYFKDTGAGIDSDHLPHIFERFFSRTYHGAGIGLTFCKNVMEALGGNITCESVKGNYTLFTLSFPSNIKSIV